MALEILEGNKSSWVDPSKGSLVFDYMSDCSSYLNTLGLPIKTSTVSKHIKAGTPFHDFSRRGQDESLPDNFDYAKIDLLIEEHKSKVVEVEPVKNRTKKGIIVKSTDSVKVFSSIMDGVRYYQTQGIRLERKALYVSLAKGTKYKGLSFEYSADNESSVK